MTSMFAQNVNQCVRTLNNLFHFTISNLTLLSSDCCWNIPPMDIESDNKSITTFSQRKERTVLMVGTFILLCDKYQHLQSCSKLFGLALPKSDHLSSLTFNKHKKNYEETLFPYT